MCNECKFLTGFWARNAGIGSQSWRGRSRNSNVGTASVPVVKGRQRRCHDATERYFEGLFPVAADEQYPHRWKIYREENCDWWTLWNIRCPGCAVWQERMAYRKGGAYGVKATPADPDNFRDPEWDGPHFEEWRCNRCLASSEGKEELSNRLLAFWKSLVEYEIMMFSLSLKSGWYSVERIADLTQKKYSWEQIVKRHIVSSQLLRTIPEPKEIAKMDVGTRRQYFEMLKHWYDTLDDPVIEVDGLADLRRWMGQYSLFEKRIEDLEGCTKALEEDPKKLVEFALRG